MAEAILFSQMQPDAEWEDDFNDWYNQEHVPARMAVPGFTAACRYVAVSDAVRYAVAYYMESIDVMETPQYKQLKTAPGERTDRILAAVTGFTRYPAVETARFVNPNVSPDPTEAPYLHAVLFSVPDEWEAEFDAWYNQEHCPLLMTNPHWWQIRRYRIRSGTPDRWTHLSLHHLGDLSAMESEERKRARSTDWRNRLAQEPWFKGEYALYRRLRTFRGTPTESREEWIR